MTLTNKQFNELYKKYNSKITRYIFAKANNREDAQELVENVLIKIAQNIHNFDETKSQLQTWVYNIAKNVLIDYWRKKKLVTVSINVDNDEDNDYVEHVDVVEPSLNPLEQLIHNDELSMIREKFNEMGSTERKVMTMYAVQGKSYDEIVNELGLSLGTVKGTIHRARTRMREAFPQLVNA
jgi:RNA polymerase sigma-70 factor (ECF subfamily)